MTEDYEEKFDLVDLEPDLMSAFLQDRKMWVDYKDHIDNSYFTSKEVSHVFQIFRAYFNKYKDFPTKKQAMLLAKRKNYGKNTLKIIDDIFYKEELKKSEIDFLRYETGEFIKNNKVERAILSSIDLIKEKKYHDVRDLVTDAVHWDPDVNLGTDYADAVARYTALHELYLNITASPWESLNHYLGGGFFRKELYLFAGSSSVGKSLALDQVAMHAWDTLGLNVVVITLEMSEERKGQRMDACKFGIPVSDVLGKKKTIINYFENNKRKNKLFIKEMPTSYTTSHIEQYLYQLKLYKNLHKIHLLVVDYMDILSPIGRKSGKEYTDQGKTGLDLRDLAKSENIPTVSGSQFSRQVMDLTIDEITEGKIADSWKKIMVGDGVIAMANTPEERANGRINYKIVKNRNGPKNVIIPLRVIYEQLKIIDPKNSERIKAREIIKNKKRNKK